MSKKDWGLLAYLGYKAIKNEPVRVSEEIGNCILGWIFVIIMAAVIYIVMTLILAPPRFITDNLNLIGILIFVILICIFIFFNTNIGPHRKNNSKKFKYDKKTSEKIKKTYSEKISCPNCGKEINKKAVRCKYCNYYFKDGLVKAKSNTKKSRSNVLYSDRSVDLTKQKELEGKPKHVRCKRCNHVIDVDFGVCEYCGYEIGPMRKFKK